MIINIFITLFTVILMEGITWFTHKFVMHGFLWYLHEDHHQPRYNSVNENFNYLFFIGIGILVYGICYFIVHDVIIHQRFKWFKNIKWKYIQALRKGHRMHHKSLIKEGGESFGMLIVPWRYFKEKYKF